MPIFAIPSRFESLSSQKDHYRNRFNSIAVDQQAGYVFRYETGAKYNALIINPFDAENIVPKNGNLIRFASEGRGLCQTWYHFDALKDFEHPSTGIPAKFEWLRSYDTASSGRFHAIKPSFQQISNQFDSMIFLKVVGTSGLFDAKAMMFEQITNCFDVMPGYQNTVTVGRFDAFGSVMTAISRHHQAFVKPGWRIFIRNTETNEKRDLGFIEFDAVEKAIKDVDLTDGDYEITLLYSSLFWKDAIDRVVRNVTIRSGENPVLGLPPVLNLRSEIEDGVTHVLWESESGFVDVEFGLWFAESPPVVVMREPDQTVAYTASEVEYSVNITQSVPLWCVVMAIKGNMRGTANEIYLPWSNDSPRRPDDQVAFDVFLDEKLLKRKSDAFGQVEGIAWNTSHGYW